jgi:hypothetical protein
VRKLLGTKGRVRRRLHYKDKGLRIRTFCRGIQSKGIKISSESWEIKTYSKEESIVIFPAKILCYLFLAKERMNKINKYRFMNIIRAMS